MEIVEGPRVVHRPEIAYLGIRCVTPFRGMLSTRDRLLTELTSWIGRHDVGEVGPYFLRLHVIDMDGPMDLEVGAVTAGPHPGDDGVRPGLLPDGDYATLTYRAHARRANRALIEWARDNGIRFDRRDDPAGDVFACRYEAYLTDPTTEPRKMKWDVELNIRVLVNRPETG